MTENPGDLLTWVGNEPVAVQLPNPASFSSLTVAGVAVNGGGGSATAVSRQTIAGFMTCSDGDGNETTNNTVNTRNLFFVPTNSSLTDITVAFPGSSFNGPEVDNPNAYTVTAAIEYPAGTYTPLYSNGNRSLTVNVGRMITKFDPCSSLVIPPGAQYFIKTFCSWTGGFWDNSFGVILNGNIVRFGVGLADQTLTTITGGSVGILGGGFCPVVYGRVTSPVVLGILGTSHDRGSADFPDPNSGGAIAWARALRGVIPVTTVGKVGITATVYLTRTDGANIIFRDTITHLLFDMASNDIFTGATLATCQSNLQAAIAPFLLRGVKVYSMTVTPRTTSTDVWMTLTNQTVSNPAGEAVRIAYNAWLRANYQSLGITAIFDIGHVIDPTDSGLWSLEPTAVTSSTAGAVCRAWAVMSGGSIASMPIAFGAINGALFPANATVPCIVRNCPGDTTGHGAVVNANCDGTGKITSYTIVNGGSNYLYPPMVAPAARRTFDGIHYSSGGGYDYMIASLGISPASFT